MPAADLTPYYQPPGTGADGTKFDNALAYLQTIVNGLDQNNFAAGKIFDPSKLMQNAAVDGDPLVWDNTLSKWAPASTLAAGRPRAPRVVTYAMSGGPPASPVDQDIWIATAVDANGTRWAFQYNAGSASSFKWEFIGGSPLKVAPATSSVASAGTWTRVMTTALAPRSGDYKIVFNAACANTSGNTPQQWQLVPNNASGSISSVDPNFRSTYFTSTGLSVSSEHILAGVTSSIDVYWQTAAITTTFNQATLLITPVRIA